MRHPRFAVRLAGLLALACVAGTAAPALAMADPGTGFTYQGSLSQNGEPVTGLRDMRFRLYDVETGGAPVATVQAFNVDITGGLFSVEIDFGAGPWAANQQLWVEIEAGPADQSQSYEIIGRQKLTATPYALNTRGILVDDIDRPTMRSPALRQADDPDASEGLWRVINSTNFGEFVLRKEQNGSVLTTPVVITENGNVGIGTADPRRPLDVRRNGLAVQENALSGDTSHIFAANDPNIDIIGLNTGSELGGVSLKEVDENGALTDHWSLHRRTGATGSTLRFTYGTSPDSWVNPAIMSMLPNGNVGIGTADPIRTLSVNGSLGANDANFDGLRADNIAFGLLNNLNSGTVASILTDNNRVGLYVGYSGLGGEAEAAIFDGDVSISDTLTVDKLQAPISAGTGEPGFMFMEASSYFVEGIMGIGGNISGGEAQLVVQADNVPSRTSILKAYGPTNATVFDIQSSGLVFCNGLVLCASDERLKHDVHPISRPLDSVLALNGVTFQWNDDQPAASQGEQIGFIAQEVEGVLPQLVEEGPDGIKAVSYANLTAVLVEAVKEQQVGIEARDARIDDLEARVDALEAQAASADDRGIFGASMLWPMAMVGGVGGLALAARRKASGA